MFRLLHICKYTVHIHILYTVIKRTNVEVAVAIIMFISISLLSYFVRVAPNYLNVSTTSISSSFMVIVITSAVSFFQIR